MPIQPKDTETILKEFNEAYDYDGPGVDSDWLRQALASHLLWAAEQGAMSKEQREAEDLLFGAVKDGMDDILAQARVAHSKGYHRGQEAFKESLQSLAQKIVE